LQALEYRMTWQPRFGAIPGPKGTQFRVWAPDAEVVEVELYEGAPGTTKHSMEKYGDGTFALFLPGVQAGARYAYRVNGQGPFPDPASRFQPEGVHGPSEIVEPCRFAWTDQAWKGRGLEELVLYELHVGTFTPRGTFAGVIDKLPYLAELGVTALELMPVADFPGQRNWGYDGVSLFAPARCYGRPDDLRCLVDVAHAHGLAVHLDVVYNHLGPDGNYLGAFSPYYASRRHHTTWGAAINFDGEHSDLMRAFLIENALHWVHEYHLDGLRLDATHAIMDNSPRHFLAELAEEVHASVTGRPVVIIAEDHNNLPIMVRPPAEGGWGLDAVWADDFHHQVRRLLAGDNEGYYRDYRGTTTDLAATIRQGWFYCGQHSKHWGTPRGGDPAGIPMPRFVWCIQNHDQVGNRAMGERLHHQIDLASYRAACVLLLCSPATPLLFMGQEWAARSPFLFFTDHNPELGPKVTEGRRREFRHFTAFTDPVARQRIPDPQAWSTFEASRLNWDERKLEPHASVERLHRALLHLRRHEPALQGRRRDQFSAAAGEDALVLWRRVDEGEEIAVVVHCRGRGVIRLEELLPRVARHVSWQPILTTEDAAFAPDSCPPDLRLQEGQLLLAFQRPGAVILRNRGA